MPALPHTCAWVPTHLHHSAADLAEWNGYSAAVRAAADAAASLILWAATGRQYDSCVTIARPVLCQNRWSEMDLASVADDGPVDVGGGNWIGSIPLSSEYMNLNPFRARLPGPVSAITLVTIDGVVVPPASYRLDEGEWLVRTDRIAWPRWQDVNLVSGTVGTWVVTYLRGIPVPSILLAAAGTYALEWARATAPTAATTCRLPGRTKELIRQGLTLQMVDPTQLLDEGLTGLSDVDPIIRALNPTRQRRPPRVLTPGMAAQVVPV